jgi:uncharacterized protein YkuJ
MKSNLVAIIKRLEAMLESTDSEVQVRRFEQDGVVKAEVSFDKATGTFSLTEADTNFTSTFDDIDIVAMEIYDLIF